MNAYLQPLVFVIVIVIVVVIETRVWQHGFFDYDGDYDHKVDVSGSYTFAPPARPLHPELAVMNELPRILIITGIVLVVVGLIWHFAGGRIPLGRLPGDIRVEREGGGGLYFPIVTCIILSIVVSLLLNLAGRLR